MPPVRRAKVCDRSMRARPTLPSWNDDCHAIFSRYTPRTTSQASTEADPDMDNYVIARSGWKLHGGLLPHNRPAHPIGLRPPAGAWPAGPRVVPERWAGARDPLPAPASGLAAAALPVHSRRAARPPSLLTIGPEGARLSALSLPDPHSALAHAGVILAAAAAHRPPACHRPQPGADKPGRRRRRRRSRRCWRCHRCSRCRCCLHRPPPPSPSPPSPPPLQRRRGAPRRAHAPPGPPLPHARCRGGLAPGMARVAAAPGFGGGVSRAERLFGASQVAAAFL